MPHENGERRSWLELTPFSLVVFIFAWNMFEKLILQYFECLAKHLKQGLKARSAKDLAATLSFFHFPLDSLILDTITKPFSFFHVMEISYIESNTFAYFPPFMYQSSWI